MYGPSVRVLIQCEDCGQRLVDEDGIAPSGAYIVPTCTCRGDSEQDRTPHKEHQEPDLPTDHDTGEWMRQAAKFILDHGGLLRHALAGHADTLNEQAAILLQVADSGGSALVTAQAAADTAARKDGEALRLRVALTALEEITLLF